MFSKGKVLVRITAEFQHKLMENISNKRPPARTIHSLNYSLNFGALIPDFTQFSPSNGRYIGNCVGNIDLEPGKPIFTIEFKPKWGTLPVSQFIKKRNDCKYNYCRFCMHQSMKLKQQIIQSISSYCPLLFFSGIHFFSNFIEGSR